MANFVMKHSERAYQNMNTGKKEKKWLMTGSVKISFTICISVPATSFYKTHTDTQKN